MFPLHYWFPCLLPSQLQRLPDAPACPPLPCLTLNPSYPHPTPLFMCSGSQKCLSAPPGGAPFAMSERAMEKLKGRKTKPATFNLDMNLIGDYVSC